MDCLSHAFTDVVPSPGGFSEQSHSGMDSILYLITRHTDFISLYLLHLVDQTSHLLH